MEAKKRYFTDCHMKDNEELSTELETKVREAIKDAPMEE